MKVIGVRFKPNGKVYYFDPMDLAPEKGQYVIVETARGIEIGQVTFATREIESDKLGQPIKGVVRIADQADLDNMAEIDKKSKWAMQQCQEMIRKANLDMKLVDIEYAFDHSKIIFYFTADGRVDFRELVRNLASVFQTRIELRQIGVRDETKMLGGLGSCGRVICCNSYLGDFQSVSIKMAKDQNLSLNPLKISGLCGRLMCCLKYESSYYADMRKKMPKVGKEVETPDGIGVVTENNALKQRVHVRVSLPDKSLDMREYDLEEVKPLEASRERPAVSKPVENKSAEGKAAAPVNNRPSRPVNRGERHQGAGGQQGTNKPGVMP